MRGWVSIRVSIRVRVTASIRVRGRLGSLLPDSQEISHFRAVLAPFSPEALGLGLGTLGREDFRT
jgi:hypothetical protein